MGETEKEKEEKDKQSNCQRFFEFPSPILALSLRACTREELELLISSSVFLKEVIQTPPFKEALYPLQARMHHSSSMYATEL